MQKNHKLVWGIVIVIVAVAAIVWIASPHEPAPAAPQETAKAETPAGKEDISSGSVNATVSAGAKPVTLSYKDALVKYADRRIQIDSKCQAFPNTITYKNNTDIMIDNRGPQDRSIHLGSYYTVKGYGFKIINVSLSKVPTTFLVDCDSQQNVATILIQG